MTKVITHISALIVGIYISQNYKIPCIKTTFNKFIKKLEKMEEEIRNEKKK